MTVPNSGPSEESDTPPPGFYVDGGQETAPEEPTKDQNPPSEDSYQLSSPEYSHYHDTDEKLPHDDSQDYIYLDYNPTLHEHKPDAHDHPHYDHSYYHPPPLNNTYQAMPSTYGMEENRNKRPYTYYYIGRKLWYIPLYFSVYFIVYVTSLLVKSIARHKIRYPQTYWDGYGSRALGNDLNKRQLELATEQITKALETNENRYG
jgi:hypothetical protein